MSERLEDIAAKMVAPGKGILAADESSGGLVGQVDRHEEERHWWQKLFWLY